MSNLAAVKVGDELAIIPGGWSPSIEKVKAARVTKSFVVDDRGGKWSLRCGSAWGSGATWSHHSHCEPWTEEHHVLRGEINAARATALARRKLGDYDYRKLDLRQCERVLALLDELNPPAKSA